jgi:hypothetical protein
MPPTIAAAACSVTVVARGHLVQLVQRDGLAGLFLTVETLGGELELVRVAGTLADPGVRERLLMATEPAARRDDLRRVLARLVP